MESSLRTNAGITRRVIRDLRGIVADHGADLLGVPSNRLFLAASDVDDFVSRQARQLQSGIHEVSYKNEFPFLMTVSPEPAPARRRLFRE